MSAQQLRLTMAGAVALICLCFSALIDLRTTLAAYLVGWITIASIPIGALTILPMTYLVRRAWTDDLHPILVAVLATLPLCGVLFVPVLLGQSLLYPAASGASLPAFKTIYLAPWVFALRAIIYFVIWSVLAGWLALSWGSPARMIRSASVTLIVASLTVSLAGIDWFESLSADFHSSIYGLLFLSFTILSSLAFSIGFGLLSPHRIPSVRGYGGLFVGTLLLWAYLHAMQYIVIWAGNIPDEVTWYLDRSDDGWQYVVMLLAFGQFVVPFLLLLSERVRRNRHGLLALCAASLCMRAIEAAVLALPELDDLSPLLLTIAFVAALFFVGCSAAALFSHRLRPRTKRVNAPAAPAET
jgi:hypothetical protein